MVKSFITFLFSFLYIFSYVDNEFKIHFLYVGAGDCAIIEYKNDNKKFLFLVDCGRNISIYKKTNTVKYIRKLCSLNKSESLKNNTEINVILTHPHTDHFWDFKKIKNNFKINCLYYSTLYEDYKKLNFLDKYFNSVFYNSHIRDAIKDIPNDKKNMVYADEIIFKDENLEIHPIWPVEEYKNRNNDINDNSMVLLVNFKGKKILLMADAGISAEKEIIERYKNTDMLKNIEIVKIGHHGHDTSSSVEFVNLFKPKYVINSTGPHPLTCGLCNLHERKYIIDRWKSRCSNVFTTEKNGNVIIFFNNKTKEFELETKIN